MRTIAYPCYLPDITIIKTVFVFVLHDVISYVIMTSKFIRSFKVKCGANYLTLLQANAWWKRETWLCIFSTEIQLLILRTSAILKQQHRKMLIESCWGNFCRFWRCCTFPSQSSLEVCTGTSTLFLIYFLIRWYAQYQSINQSTHESINQSTNEWMNE